jgi:hypothetical protein
MTAAVFDEAVFDDAIFDDSAFDGMPIGAQVIIDSTIPTTSGLPLTFPITLGGYGAGVTIIDSTIDLVT